MHASQLDSTPDRKPASKPATGPVQADRTGPDEADQADRTGGPDRTTLTDEEAVRLIRELDQAARGPVSDRTIRAEVGCGAGRAKRLAVQARAIHAAA
jgi:hypothetical protein